MKLLVIGGSQFVGRHLVVAALARGDQVTMFNRGKTQAAPPPGVDWRQGDRTGDLAALRHGQWDAVVDACGYFPADVRRMAQALDAQIGRYVYISSVSAYASTAQPNDEHSMLGRIDDEASADVIDGRSYGPLKAACERALVPLLGERSLCIRPGLVVGPHDPTQRFTWWPARLARAALDGQPVLAPGDPAKRVQFIDARDLADFTLHAIDARLSGAYNAVAPAGFTTMGGLLQACAAAAGAPAASLKWASEEALQREAVKPWSDMPLWLPAGGEYTAFLEANSARAVAAGLKSRSLEVTVADTLAWWRGLPEAQWAFDKAGLPAEREAALLAAI